MTDPIDLDAAEALFQAGDWAASIQHARRRTGLAIVAELRVAREVVEFAEYVDADAPDSFRRSSAMVGLRSALRAYHQVTDQHADPSTHDRSGEGGP